MKLKRFLLIIAIPLSVVGVYVSHAFLLDVARFLSMHPWVLIAVIAAVVVQLLGHILRAQRTKIVIDQAATSSLRFQFGALAVGYLFNTLLPFRSGEIIRALVIARRLHISLLYTFSAIVIERATDLIFLGLLVIIGVLLIGGFSQLGLVVAAIVGVSFGLVIICVTLLLKNENESLLRCVNWFAQLFNASLANRIRFKVWSLIFGLQSFLNNPKLVRQYIAYAALSWLCYLISSAIIVILLLHIINPAQFIVLGVSPYVIGLNPLDANSYQLFGTLLPISISSFNLDIFAKVTWSILMLPMTAAGLFALIMYRPGNKKTASKIVIDPYTNKLMRHRDISQEFPAFLETYFKGFSLSRVLHKIEVTGELSLVKFFKGGSDAITVLALKDNKLFVKKIVPAVHTERLRVQYKWLKKHASKKQIVDVLAEHKATDYYAIDLSYNPDHISLFEYIHTRSLKQSKKALDDVWRYVSRNIYDLDKESSYPRERDVYIEERLMKKVAGAINVNQDLSEVVHHKKIKINDQVYDNFYEIVEKIKSNPDAWRDLSIYRKSKVIHGDLTVDNILMDTKTDRPFIIDPSDDNQVRGPIIDFARHTQSLAAGYEFLNNDDGPVSASKDGKYISINYHDSRSAKYMQLNDYLDTTLAHKYLTETERKTVVFHTGLLYGRMLAHRVVINPRNTLKYYAVCVVLLNEFYRQYE